MLKMGLCLKKGGVLKNEVCLQPGDKRIIKPLWFQFHYL